MTTMDLEVIRVDAAEPHATVVLVHGAWHGAWCWQDGFAQRLAEQGVSSAAVSLRGHAGSADERRLNGMRVRGYVDDVIDVITATSGVPFVAGHSMGGFVVQSLLARTERPPIAGAALLATVPPYGVKGVVRDLLRQHPGQFFGANLTLNLGRLVRTEEQVRELFFTPDSPAAAITATAARVQSESYLAFLDMLFRDRPKPRSTPEPLLVLAAEHDGIFPASDTTATAEQWGADYRTVAGIGHDLMLDEGWEQTADLLAGWIITGAHHS